MIYYVHEGARSTSLKKCQELGLGYAADGRSPTHTQIVREFNGAPMGTLFSFLTGNLAGANASSNVQFRPYPGKPGLFLGFDPDRRPTPKDCARSEQSPGHPVELADGSVWTIPPARLVDGSSGLPQLVQWNGEHWVPNGHTPDNEALFSAACVIWDLVVGTEGAQAVTVNDSLNLACQAIAVNYALGPAEISALGLIDTRAAERVLLALIDWPSAEALARGKAEAAGLSGEPGGKDSTQATAQPSLTC